MYLVAERSKLSHQNDKFILLIRHNAKSLKHFIQFKSHEGTKDRQNTITYSQK